MCAPVYVCVCPEMNWGPVQGVFLSPSDCLNRLRSALAHAVKSGLCVWLTLTSPVGVVRGAAGLKYDPRVCISMGGGA